MHTWSKAEMIAQPFYEYLRRNLEAFLDHIHICDVYKLIQRFDSAKYQCQVPVLCGSSCLAPNP